MKDNNTKQGKTLFGMVILNQIKKGIQPGMVKMIGSIPTGIYNPKHKILKDSKSK